MPLFEYQPVNLSQCNACCFFETLQNHEAPPLTACPTCSSAITKSISSFAIAKSTENKSYPFAAPAPEQSPLNAMSPAQRVAKLATAHTCSANCKCGE